MKFWVYNAGNKIIQLQRGDQTFSIWFSAFDQEVSDPFNRNGPENLRITSSDLSEMVGSRASPASLKVDIEQNRAAFEQKIDALQLKHEHLMGWAQCILGIALAIFFMFAGLILDKYLFSSDEQKLPQVQVNFTGADLNKTKPQPAETVNTDAPKVSFPSTPKE